MSNKSSRSRQSTTTAAARSRSATPPPDLPSLRVDSAGAVTLDGRTLDTEQLRAILQAHGITAPRPTGATYDVTTEQHHGFRFNRTPKWLVAAGATLLTVAAAVFVIVSAARAIAVDVRTGHEDAIGASMAAIVCAVLYGAVVVVVYGYAVREKYRAVNRLDPRLWIRELRRIQKLAQRAPSDADIEDAALDRYSTSAIPQLPREGLTRTINSRRVGP